MAKTAILSIKIISDAKNAAKGLDDTAKGADKVAASGKAASGRMEAMAESSDRVASKGAQAAGALGGLGDLVGGSFGQAMVTGGIAMQAAADSGDLLNVVTDSNIVKTARQTIVTTANTAATKAAALGQRILNAAMRANPIGLLITALLIAVGLFTLAYKKSSTFRGIVQATGRAGAAAVGWIVDKAKSLLGWFGKLGPAVSKGKDIAVGAFKLYIKPITSLLDLIKKVVGWIKNIKFPKPPKWLSKVGGFVGLGGGDDGPHAPGGRMPPGGRGGPGDGGLFTTFGGSGSGFGTLVQIEVTGAIDPVSTAKQIAKLLRQQNIRVTGVTA